MLYAYDRGTESDVSVSKNKLWSYNTTNGSWSSTPITESFLNADISVQGVYASDPASGLSFYTGGKTIGFNNTDNGLVKLDSSQSGMPQWSFEMQQLGTQFPNILDGAMVHIRKGKAGVLIAFGGYNTTRRGTQFGPGWDWDQRSFADIFVYDIYSNTWYGVAGLLRAIFPLTFT